MRQPTCSTSLGLPSTTTVPTVSAPSSHPPTRRSNVPTSGAAWIRMFAPPAWSRSSSTCATTITSAHTVRTARVVRAELEAMSDSRAASRRAAIAVSTAPVATIGLYRQGPSRSAASAAVSKIVSTHIVDSTRRMGTVASMPDVVLPVLDEAEAIPGVLARLPRGYEPIVVDNGSTDGSAKVALRLGARVVMEPSRGFGAACFTGLRAATQRGRVLHGLRRLARPERTPPRGHAGQPRRSRPRRGRTPPRPVPAHGRCMHASQTVRCRFSSRGEWAPACTTSARCGRRGGKNCSALGVTDRRFGWPLEMVVRAVGAGWRILEVPVSYAPRIGQSKVTGTVRGTARTVLDMARVMW